MNLTRRNKLEHDIGYIIKSPCRECGFKKRLPDCSNKCKTMKRLQASLACVTSCSNNYSELEAFSCNRMISD